MRPNRNHWHEPWRAAPRAIDVAEPFPYGPPEGADPDAVDRLRAASDRLAHQASYVVWGSGMAEPAKAMSLDGKPCYMNGEGVIVFVTHPATKDDSLRARDVAERMAACVNACKGVREPETVIPAVRDLLRDLCIGDADPTDPRIASLLSKLLPAQERE